MSVRHVGAERSAGIRVSLPGSSPLPRFQVRARTPPSRRRFLPAHPEARGRAIQPHRRRRSRPTAKRLRPPPFDPQG
jgi:hypothetical protein